MVPLIQLDTLMTCFEVLPKGAHKNLYVTTAPHCIKIQTQHLHIANY